MVKLAKMKVRDIMKTEVERLDPSMPIAEAIELLDDNEITGAPVTDESGRLLGVLSARDVTRREHVRAGRIDPERGEFSMGGPLDEEREEENGEDVIYSKEDYSPAVIGQDTVAEWMNHKAITIEPGASVKDACSRMLQEHVHRLIVAEQGRLEGILSSFDIVRVVAENGAD